MIIKKTVLKLFQTQETVKQFLFYKFGDKDLIYNLIMFSS